LHVVRGNWAEHLADRLCFDLKGWQTLLVHDMAHVPTLLDAGTRLVITDHSHKPRMEWRGDQLFLNPGSAGPRRFKLPVTLALLEVQTHSIEPRLVSLLE
jgi:predicted phosphodiesterase